MLFGFSLKLVYCTMCGKILERYGVLIPRTCIESRHFYSCPCSLRSQTSSPSSYHHKLGIDPGNIFSKFFFSQQQKRRGGSYDFLYQNLIRKSKGDLLPLFFNHDNLILKLHGKIIATLMKGGFYK